MSVSILQLRVLDMIEASCRPIQLDVTKPELSVIPLCTMHLPDAWASYYTRDKFIENLCDRGFSRLEKLSFLYITDAGRELLAIPRNMKRLDDYYEAEEKRHNLLARTPHDQQNDS